MKMKKIGIICAMALVALAGLSSCQETSERHEREIAYKIQNKEALTDADYAMMIDYVGEYAEKAQKYVDMQINGTDLQEASEGMMKLNGEYLYLNEFRNCIRFTPVSQLNEENLNKVGEFAGYVEFTAPSGYTIQTMGPKEAGLEVAAPEEENGVVAGSVDEVKEELKNDW